ncbi:hypothetical protein HBA92_00465 [Ochrobactrum sp. MR28]|nr:hypothetical protein [Ochrobactrum sp. MR28]
MSQTTVKPVLQVSIPLSVPVPVTGADGKEATRDKIIMRRPRTVHAKRLAILIGADLFKSLFADAGEAAVQTDKVDARKLASDVFASLLTASKLEELTVIIADMCTETPQFIDDLDPLDLLEVAKGFADFFPKLQALASGTSAPNAQSSIAGAPQT